MQNMLKMIIIRHDLFVIQNLNYSLHISVLVDIKLTNTVCYSSFNYHIVSYEHWTLPPPSLSHFVVRPGFFQFSPMKQSSICISIKNQRKTMEEMKLHTSHSKNQTFKKNLSFHLVWWIQWWDCDPILICNFFLAQLEQHFFFGPLWSTKKKTPKQTTSFRQSSGFNTCTIFFSENIQLDFVTFSFTKKDSNKNVIVINKYRKRNWLIRAGVNNKV